MSATVLAVDLGGAHYRAGAASSDNPASVRPIGAWPRPSTRDEFLAMLESQFAELGATRLGLAIPGLADGTTCRWVPNVPYLDGLDLAACFPHVDVALGNDAHLALLAEASAGAAAKLSDAILLAIGTGIGSAVLADGRIIGGSRGGACSFGWAAADLVDPEEDRHGWLELHCSGRALDRVAQGIGLNDGADLVERARAGELSRDGRASSAYACARRCACGRRRPARPRGDHLGRRRRGCARRASPVDPPIARQPAPAAHARGRTESG